MSKNKSEIESVDNIFYTEFSSKQKEFHVSRTYFESFLR